MLSGDAPGQLPTFISTPPVNGTEICDSQLANGSVFTTGSEGNWPVNTVAGDDLRVEIARVTTCGSFSISGGIQSFLSGSQDYVSQTYFDVTVIPGCTDFDACNYDAGATIDDSFCDYSCYGCTDAMACNYDDDAILENESCEYLTCIGCTDPMACNFEEEATIDDEGCTYAQAFLDCDGQCLFDSDGDGVCDELEVGCTEPSALNFDETATDPDGSCAWVGVNCEVSENVFDIVEGLSILPFEPSEVIYGVDTAVNLVVVLPPVVSEPGTGSLFNAVSFAVDTIDGLPPGMDTESLPGTIPAEETACLVLAGVPQQEGWFDVSIEGHLTVSFFGQHLTLSGVSISHAVFVSENPNPIAGCTYGLAVNYLSYANLDDGSCLIAGCTNPEACNHQPLASLDDGTCNYECWGCTYDSASNFDTAATRDDGSCAFGPSPFNCNEDLNNDGNVGSSDLLDLLAGFGSPCGAP